MTTPIRMEAPPDAPTRWFRLARVIAEVRAHSTSVFSRSRQQDWALGVLAIGMGAILVFLLPDVSVGTDNSFTADVSGRQWGIILVFLAVVRFAALRINGAWRTGWSALVRGISSLAAFVFWFAVGISELLAFLDGGGNPFTPWLLIWIASCEVACTARAIDDMLCIRVAGRLSAADGDDGGN